MEILNKTVDNKKIKVMFINMPIRESAVPNCLPYGLLSVATQLLKSNIEPVILDLNAYRIQDDISKQNNLPFGRWLNEKEIKDLLSLYLNKYGEFHLVCMSGMITTMAWQERIAKLIRQEMPDTFLLSGGGLATEIKGHLLKWIPQLDAVCIHEGEIIINEIIKDALDKANGTARQEKFVYQGFLPKNLDDINIPDYSLITEHLDGFPTLDIYLQNYMWDSKSTGNCTASGYKPKKSINIITSRGCPYGCKFCFHTSGNAQSYKYRTAEHTFKEIKYCHEKLGVDFIGFLDDNFMANSKRIKELQVLMADYKSKLKWGAHARLDSIVNANKNYPDFMNSLSDMGCNYIGFGGESASPSVLKAMGKGGMILTNGMTKYDNDEFPTTMVEAIKLTVDAGVYANLTWIMGYPGETLTDLKHTVRFILWQEEYYKKVNPHWEVNKNIFVATAYPGTEMFNDSNVQTILHKAFNITAGIFNKQLHDYVLGLEDASKLMKNLWGDIINYSAMNDRQFLQAKNYIDEGNIYKILNM